MVKDEGKRPTDYDEPVKVKKIKKSNEDENENEVNSKTRSLDDSDNQNEVQVKKRKIINYDWGLGKGYSTKKIVKYHMTKEEFFDYIRNHKTLSTTNLLDIHGYGNTR